MHERGWLGVLFALAFVVIVGGGIVTERFNAHINDIKAEQAAGATRGYVSRAETCKVQVALNIPLDKDCLDPHITVYYDPNALPTAGSDSPGQVRNLNMLCTIQEQLGIPQNEDCSK